MGHCDYDIARYQPVLRAAGSPGQVDDELGSFFAPYDDAMLARLVR